jgi:hypothetical protein
MERSKEIYDLPFVNSEWVLKTTNDKPAGLKDKRSSLFAAEGATT